jgi:hypothetical protein
LIFWKTKPRESFVGWRITFTTPDNAIIKAFLHPKIF